ncbi:MAG TPA: hypothetical protein DD979_16855 [Gammaproteobacteria bacterium]|jgi:nitrite reductase (NADH) large subunit|nr:hypothetical protein [Gammaproteobacteria bacterium]
MSNRQQLVLIGNGMAGVRTVEELLRLAPDAYDITVLGEEPHTNYNRIMLSPLLANETTLADIVLNDAEWYAAHGITLRTGVKAERIHRAARTVEIDTGEQIPYDKLIIATGSNPIRLPLPGADKTGVIGFRDISDVRAMQHAAKHYRKAVVIGGGLLGLEAANGLLKQGMDVTVVHLASHLMERQLDPYAAGLLQKSLEARGMHFLMEHASDHVLGEDRVTGIAFSNGHVAETDLLVMAVGIRPNIEIARESGLHCDRGIVVNDTLQTYDPRIYAVGECAQHRGTVYGLVAPLFDMGKVAANHLAGLGISRYQGSVTSTRLKVTGINLFSAGDFTGNGDTETLVLKDPGFGVYKKIVLKDSVIQGCVLYGDTQDGAWYFELMNDEVDVSDLRDALIFGPPKEPPADRPSAPAKTIAIHPINSDADTSAGKTHSQRTHG